MLDMCIFSVWRIFTDGFTDVKTFPNSFFVRSWQCSVKVTKSSRRKRQRLDRWRSQFYDETSLCLTRKRLPLFIRDEFYRRIYSFVSLQKIRKIVPRSISHSIYKSISKNFMSYMNKSRANTVTAEDKKNIL